MLKTRSGSFLHFSVSSWSSMISNVPESHRSKGRRTISNIIVKPKKDGTYRAISKRTPLLQSGASASYERFHNTWVVSKRKSPKLRSPMSPSVIHECPLPDTLSQI